MDSKYLSILDNTEKEVLKIYTYNFSSELMGREILTVELDLPIQYKNGVEQPYPFSTAWHIKYNNNVYFLNNATPVGKKDNEKRYIHYTLVFENGFNQLDNVFIKPFGRVFTDKDNDGYADENEIISDIQFGGASGFYGNIYDLALFLRRNLEYSFGYITDENGEPVMFDYKYVKNQITEETAQGSAYIPKFVCLLDGINYNLPLYSNDITDAENGILPVPNILGDIETANRNSASPNYPIADKQSIDSTKSSYREFLKRVNESFVYKEKINGRDKEVGYIYDCKSIALSKKIIAQDNKQYSFYCVTLKKKGENVVDANNNKVIFEYGGLTKDGGLLSIERNTNENKLPTRIYATGSGENLPINYFHIYEDRTDEVAELGSTFPYRKRKIPSLEYLKDYFANGQHPDELSLTKLYLVPNKEWDWVYDKYFYTKIYQQIGNAEYVNDGTWQIKKSTVKIVNNVDTNSAQFQLVEGGDWTDMSFGVIYLTTDDSGDVRARAYILDNITEQVRVWDENDMWWCYDIYNAKQEKVFDENLNPLITDDFLKNGTTQNLQYSHIIILVNGEENIPQIRQADKIYYIIRKLEDGTNSYYGEYETASLIPVWYPRTETTYERCNPFPKYITQLQNLMPECFRAYVAGWYYGFLYAKHYPADEYNIAKKVEVATDGTSLTFNERYKIRIFDNSGFPLAYMPMYDEEQNFVDWELLGVIDTNTKSKYYNYDLFLKGLKDFCVGISTMQTIGKTLYSYINCGKIYNPITYYENRELVEQFGLIETIESYDDIKPSLVNQWVDDLGRLDEVVDVYIPCINDNDKSKLGKYWLDKRYLQNGRNIQVPNLHIPNEPKEKSFAIVPYLDDNGEVSYASGGAKLNTVGWNFNEIENGALLTISADMPEEYTAFKLPNEEWHYGIPPIPMTYSIKAFVRLKVVDEQGIIVKNDLETVLNGEVTIGIKVYSGQDSTEYWNILSRKDLNIPEDEGDGAVEGYIIDSYIEEKRKYITLFTNNTIDQERNKIRKGTGNPTEKTGWKKCIVDITYTWSHIVTDWEDGYTIEYIKKYSLDLRAGIQKDIFLDEGNKEYTITAQKVGDYSFSLFDDDAIRKRVKPGDNWACEYLKSQKARIRLGILSNMVFNCKVAEVFDFDQRTFFVWTKDLKFNPLHPAWQGEEAPMMVFSTGDLAGIDHKFAITEFIEDITKSIDTNIAEGEPYIYNVPSKYRATLNFVLNDIADNKSFFQLIPQRNAKPKQGDLFIIENAVYPHCPYTYSAERKLYDKMKDTLNLEARYNYSLVFDEITRVKKGINFTQIKVGNILSIKNNSLVITKGDVDSVTSYDFIIKSVSIQRQADSLYDKYTIVLENLKRNTSTKITPVTDWDVTIKRRIADSERKLIAKITNSTKDTGSNIPALKNKFTELETKMQIQKSEKEPVQPNRVYTYEYDDTYGDDL